MTPRRLRRPLALAAVVTAGAFALVGATVATASHGGTENALTASNGSSSIMIAGGSQLSTNEVISDATWSPDGCRAAFIAQDGGDFTLPTEVATFRHDNVTPDGLWWIADTNQFFPQAERQHVTWRGNGADVVWSERNDSTSHWHLMMTSSSYGFTPVQLGPLLDDGTPDADGMNYTNPDAGPGRLVVFQRDTWVLLYDPNLGDTWDTRIIVIETNAANPALSPDGLKVAYVQDGDIWVENISGGAKTQVTTDGPPNDNPVWSHDGATIALTIGSDVYTVPAAGGTPTAAGISGKPAYRSSFDNKVVRLSGANRYLTAISVSKSQWTTNGGPLDGRADAGGVVLSRSDTFADALSGSALAAAAVGPLLMTSPTIFDGSTKTEIDRVLGPGDPVYLLGGLGAISQAIENEITAMGLTPVRLSGLNRFETSISIAKKIMEITTGDEDSIPDLVLAATGLNFPDALAAGAAAGSYDVPGTGFSAVVVLTADTALPAATQTYLNTVMAGPDDEDPLLFGIGGQAAAAVLSFPNPIPLVGISRYETALFTAEVFFGGEANAGIATGSNWPDALAGGALMGTLNGPLLLTPSGTPTLNLDSAFLLDITCGSINTGLIFGGTGVVNGAIDAKIGNRISGPAGFVTSTNPTLLSGGAIPVARGAQAPESVATPSGNQRTLVELQSSAKSISKRQ